MKRITTILMLLMLVCIGAQADKYYFATGPTQVTSITSGNYYVIDGLNQQSGGTAGHYLFDNGTKVTSNNPQALPTDWTAGKFIWKIVGNNTDGYTLQNVQTGKYMSLGSSNGSQISSSSTAQTNGIHFNASNYATIRNSNGQAIDIGASGGNPTTWSGSTTADGSRRLVIYKVEVVEIEDNACYTIAFNAKTSGNTWGLRSGTTEASPNANATGDVYVAHSYTNASGNKRWIFVNNSNGTYLAYHGQANTNFDISNAINEWSIETLTAGSGNVSADANCAGKVCITNDKRYAGDASAGCYNVQEANGAYDNSAAPYYNGSFTSALTFTATGDAASSAATLAIAKFEALYEVRDYLPYAGNISALFANPSSIEANINAAETASAATTIATNFMKSPEGKKFYAVCSGATGQYLNVGESYVTATTTALYPDDVMEVEYAGNGRYYLKGVKYSTYACTPNGQSNISTTSTKGSAETFYIGSQNNDTDNKVFFSNKRTSGNYGGIHYSSGYTYKCIGWTYDAGNSQWNITAISDEDYTTLFNTYCDVTYNAIMEASGATKATLTTLNVTRNSDLAVPSSLDRGYCTFKFYSDAACTSEITKVPNAATATVYVLVSSTLPFTLSENFESAKWYYATLNGKHLRADESHKDGSGRYQTNLTNEKTDVYKWAFVGTCPYDLTIMNRGAGSSKYLYAGNVPVMQVATPASDNKARWIASSNSNGGFSIRSESGATLYINDHSGAGNLGFWNTSASANNSGSNWVITEVPMIDVTYELWVGEEKVNTIVKHVPEYSPVDVPAALTNGYTTFAYNIVPVGSIEGSNCTITVTATLKSGVTPVGSLSNSKKYRLTTPTRGSLSTYTTGDNTYLASPVKSGLSISAKEFAIINFGGNYYLYSVSDAKFVTYQTDLKAPLAGSVTGTGDAVSFFQTANSVYEIRFDNSASKILNCYGDYDYGIAINGWGDISSEWDDGNQFIIEEVAGEFDATAALADLNVALTPAFNDAIAALEAYPYGTGLNQYSLVVEETDRTSQAATIIAGLKSQGCSSENLATANMLIAGSTLNMPAAGKFYRIQGATSSKYLAAGFASNNKFKMTDATDASTIFYFNDNKLTNFQSGLCNGVTTSAWAWVVGSSASTVTFKDGLTNGGYAIQTAGAHFYDNGDGANSADRGGSITNMSSENVRYRSWYLTEVTTLPVTISSAAQYATLCAPVALTIPSGVKAYTGVVNVGKNWFKLAEVETTIPANTPVVLMADPAIVANTTYNFVATTSSDFSGSNDLAGYSYAINKTDGDLVLGLSNTTGVIGFYALDGTTTLAGFKAYLPAANVSGARSLTFIFDDSETTGISSLDGEQSAKGNSAVYDLQGRKVANPSRGMYIINGRVVVVK